MLKEQNGLSVWQTLASGSEQHHAIGALITQLLLLLCLENIGSCLSLQRCQAFSLQPEHPGADDSVAFRR